MHVRQNCSFHHTRFVQVAATVCPFVKESVKESVLLPKIDIRRSLETRHGSSREPLVFHCISGSEKPTYRQAFCTQSLPPADHG